MSPPVSSGVTKICRAGL